MSGSIARIIISPQSQVQSIITHERPSHMITLVSPDTVITTPNMIRHENHLCLYFNDINGPHDELIPPTDAMVEQLLKFTRAWDQDQPLLIHCYAGISRSTAAAYLAMMMLKPDLNALACAQSLRQLAPSATPNPLMITLGDEILGHDGALIDAIASIGRGAEAYEGTPFAFELERDL